MGGEFGETASEEKMTDVAGKVTTGHLPEDSINVLCPTWRKKSLVCDKSGYNSLSNWDMEYALYLSITSRLNSHIKPDNQKLSV